MNSIPSSRAMRSFKFFPEVKISIPMSQWGTYLSNVFFRMKRPSIDELKLEADHPEVQKAQLHWSAKRSARLAANNDVLDFDGLSWAKCFLHHEALRKQLLITFGVRAPGVAQLNDAMVARSTMV